MLLYLGELAIPSLINLGAIDPDTTQQRGRLVSAVLNQSKLSAARPSRYPAPVPREATKGQAEHTSHREIGVVHKGHLDVEEDLLNAGDGQLGLELRWGSRDLGEGLEDRSARGNNKVSCAGLVPVLTVLLYRQLACFFEVGLFC